MSNSQLRFEQPLALAQEEAPYQLSFDRSELDRTLENSGQDPRSIVPLLKRDFGVELSSPAGVSEGYTIEEHTTMVLGQMKKYGSAGELPEGFSWSAACMMAGLHDMGKPRALRTGDKHAHHAFGREIIDSTFPQLGFTEREQKIAATIVDGDPIGLFLTARISSAQAARVVAAKAEAVGMSVEDYWKLQSFFYKIDAGSYTMDAGGQPSLDSLFNFQPEAGKVNFAPSTQRKIDLLEHQLHEIKNPKPEVSASSSRLSSKLGHGAASTTVSVEVPKNATTERKSSLNIEVTPTIAEAVEDYFAQEKTKMTNAEQGLQLLEWADKFSRNGAHIPEGSTPDAASEREEILAKIKDLGCEKSLDLAGDLPYAVAKRLRDLRREAGKIYGDAILPVTFMSEADLQRGDQLSERFNSLLHSYQHETKSGQNFWLDDLTPIKLSEIAQKSQNSLIEQLDAGTTMYAHTTSFLDRIIKSGALSPRSENSVANTGNHSTGVHFSRGVHKKPRFGFEGPGLTAYLQKGDLDRDNLLRGDVILPLDAIVKSAPIRVESSTTQYEYEDEWGQSSISVVNVDNPEAAKYIRSMEKQIDPRTGTTIKEAGDTLFFAAPDEDAGYNYKFPVEDAYLIVKDKRDGERARALLTEAGHSDEWIAEHLILNRGNNGIDEVRNRLAARPTQIVAPLMTSDVPYEFRDYTKGQQYQSQVRLTVLPASTLREITG